MRELLFKNMTSHNSQRRLLRMSEVITQGGVVMETQRRTVYAVESCLHINNSYDLDRLKKLQKTDQSEMRHVYIIKKHNAKTGKDTLLYRVKGFLYVVVRERVYRIAFANSFKIDVKKQRPRDRKGRGNEHD